MYGDWYARHMYVQGHPQYLYHIRHYGHPSKFGYKDICSLWKAEEFDPNELMALYRKAGARYFVGQAMHHDHFFNYPSKLNRFNSMHVGPGKDICGLWKAAVEKEGLPFGLTEHLGASFSWWRVNKGCDAHGPYAGTPYDGNDPAYRDFYLDNHEHVDPKRDPGELMPWYTSNKGFHDYWLAVMKELINRYKPDLLYSDGGLPFGQQDATRHNLHGSQEREIINIPFGPQGAALPDAAEYAPGLEAVAHLYNTSLRKHGANRAVYSQKDRRPGIYRVGVLDIEKSQLPEIRPEPWQTDTCIGDWFYDVRQKFKKPGHVIEMLVDIISKNGCLLLNILQRPDGAIDDETRYLLQELASWFTVCSQAVHGTRPWRQFGEGDTRVLIQGFKEEQTVWNSSDFRFTTRGKTLYAFMLQAPENRVAVLKSLTEEDKVVSVKLLGAGACPFSQSFGTLIVKLPPNLPTVYANCLSIEMG